MSARVSLWALIFSAAAFGCEDALPPGAGLDVGGSPIEDVGSTDAGADPVDSGDGKDLGTFDAASGDAASRDAASGDAGATDAGLGADASTGDASADGGAYSDAGSSPSTDAGASDMGPTDAADTGPTDAASDAGSTDAADAGATDIGPPDLGPPDAGPPDLGAPDAGPADAGSSSGTGDLWIEIRYAGASSVTSPRWSYSTSPGWSAGDWDFLGSRGTGAEVWDIRQRARLINDHVGRAATFSSELQLMFGLTRLLGSTGVTVDLEGRSYNCCSQVRFDVYNPATGCGVSTTMSQSWTPTQRSLDLSGCFTAGSNLQAVRIDPTSGTVALTRMRVTFHNARW